MCNYNISGTCDTNKVQTFSIKSNSNVQSNIIIYIFFTFLNKQTNFD